MSVCPQCSIRKAKRFCPTLGVRICSLCCVEIRRRGDAPCPQDCPYNMKAREAARARVQAVTRRYGSWLARRLRVFGAKEDLFSAGMNLEEALCAFSLVKASLSDQEVLEALGFLSTVSGEVTVVMSPPNLLARWLQETLRKGSGEALRPLGKLSPQARKDLLQKLLEIAGAETRMGGYMKGVEAYFQNFRRAEGKDESWFRKKVGESRGEAGSVLLG